MATHLTERVVNTAEIGTRKYVVFDEDCAGFGLCVLLSGRKGFILIYRAAGRQRLMTIGTWPRTPAARNFFANDPNATASITQQSWAEVGGQGRWYEASFMDQVTVGQPLGDQVRKCLASFSP